MPRPAAGSKAVVHVEDLKISTPIRHLNWGSRLTTSRKLSYYVNLSDGDVKPIQLGRDEDLKLIPIAESTAKKPREAVHSVSLDLLLWSSIHMGELSFKERVAQIAIEEAAQYKAVFVDYEYLICSEAFCKQDYYIISAKPDNYRHLIGVNTAISAGDFFEKCLNGELCESDFDFSKSGRSEKEIKGSVRRKIKSLPFLTSIIGKDLIVQEDYERNGIICSFATTDCNVTIGFINEGKSRPKTLLWGDSLDWNKSAFVDLILRRETGADKFTDIIIGDAEMISKYKDKINPLLATELRNRSNPVCVNSSI